MASAEPTSFLARVRLFVLLVAFTSLPQGYVSREDVLQIFQQVNIRSR